MRSPNKIFFSLNVFRFIRTATIWSVVTYKMGANGFIVDVVIRFSIHFNSGIFFITIISFTFARRLRVSIDIAFRFQIPQLMFSPSENRFAKLLWPMRLKSIKIPPLSFVPSLFQMPKFFEHPNQKKKESKTTWSPWTLTTHGIIISIFVRWIH